MKFNAQTMRCINVFMRRNSLYLLSSENAYRMQDEENNVKHINMVYLNKQVTDIHHVILSAFSGNTSEQIIFPFSVKI